ncbi:hypothetical protein T552_04087 [Pneumocystis carinii B80]|uniref:Uncharacterized protein n=1 Tax=Pneumocystis carinii (strain B80) TaxID=1408658 RepID=A0A0W4ZPL9_PNEC8|nr:hypothetical protein T552_04087 [Pneumocystis carinii B80]KTW30315.1 hypothetical protein T552_04087 [Pneumocystis carinii B80]
MKGNFKKVLISFFDFNKVCDILRMHYLLTAYSFLCLFACCLDKEISIVFCNDILIIFNSTYTSIVKTVNVKGLQIIHVLEGHDIQLHFICCDLKEIQHKWIVIVNKIHINSQIVTIY